MTTNRELADKFNKYCAEVIGYYHTVIDGITFITDERGNKLRTKFSYNPYDDLDQMDEVKEEEDKRLLNAFQLVKNGIKIGVLKFPEFKKLMEIEHDYNGNPVFAIDNLKDRDQMTIGKWCWMMDYCKQKGIPPAQSWAWEQAEKAWQLKDKDKEPESWYDRFDE